VNGLQDAEIDSLCCNAIEGVIPTDTDVNDGQRCCALEEVGIIAPSRNWTILMSVQFALIITLSTFSLYEYFGQR
jgi:hypothetical protein